MFKKLGNAWLWTIFVVNVIGLFIDILPNILEGINENLNQGYNFWKYFGASFGIFIIICVVFAILIGIFNIIYCMLQALGIINISNKPKIKQMSMYVNKDGYIDKSYFITIDGKQIPVKVYQSPEQKIEIKE